MVAASERARRAAATTAGFLLIIAACCVAFSAMGSTKGDVFLESTVAASADLDKARQQEGMAVLLKDLREKQVDQKLEGRLASQLLPLQREIAQDESELAEESKPATTEVAPVKVADSAPAEVGAAIAARNPSSDAAVQAPALENAHKAGGTSGKETTESTSAESAAARAGSSSSQQSKAAASDHAQIKAPVQAAVEVKAVKGSKATAKKGEDSKKEAKPKAMAKSDSPKEIDPLAEIDMGIVKDDMMKARDARKKAAEKKVDTAKQEAHEHLRAKVDKEESTVTRLGDKVEEAHEHAAAAGLTPALVKKLGKAAADIKARDTPKKKEIDPLKVIDSSLAKATSAERSAAIAKSATQLTKGARESLAHVTKDIPSPSPAPAPATKKARREVNPLAIISDMLTKEEADPSEYAEKKKPAPPPPAAKGSIHDLFGHGHAAQKIEKIFHVVKNKVAMAKILLGAVKAGPHGTDGQVLMTSKDREAAADLRRELKHEHYQAPEEAQANARATVASPRSAGQGGDQAGASSLHSNQDAIARADLHTLQGGGLLAPKSVPGEGVDVSAQAKPAAIGRSEKMGKQLPHVMQHLFGDHVASRYNALKKRDHAKTKPTGLDKLVGDAVR